MGTEGYIQQICGKSLLPNISTFTTYRLKIFIKSGHQMKVSRLFSMPMKAIHLEWHIDFTIFCHVETMVD